MKSRRQRKHSKRRGRRTKRGGFLNFFSSKPTVLPSECDPNQLSLIKGSDALHANYQKCCPKTYFGSKNSSPYCKQLDLNFQSSLKGENNAKEYPDAEPMEQYQMNQNPPSYPSPQLPKPEMDRAVAETKAWYKFWGGKKTRKNRKHKKK
jgi:hypothetical protein